MYSSNTEFSDMRAALEYNNQEQTLKIGALEEFDLFHERG